MLVLTSRDVWAPTQELAFGRYPLRRGWMLVRKLRRWYCSGSARKYDEAKQVERGDPLRSGLYPQGRKRRITQLCLKEVGRADKVLSGGRQKGYDLSGLADESPKSVPHRAMRSRAEAQSERDSGPSGPARPERSQTPGDIVRAEQANAADTCRVAPTERSGGRASAVSSNFLAERSEGASAHVAKKTPNGANWCRRNSFLVRMVVGMAVVFGLAGVVFLVAAILVLHSGVSVAVFLCVLHLLHSCRSRTSLL